MAELSNISQARQLLQIAEALDALGRASRTVGSFTVELKPKPRITVGRTRVDVSEGIALAFGEAVGVTFVKMIDQLKSEAHKLTSNQVPVELPMPQSPS